MQHVKGEEKEKILRGIHVTAHVISGLFKCYLLCELMKMQILLKQVIWESKILHFSKHSKTKSRSGHSKEELNIQKTKIMASSPITSGEIDEETVETVSDFIFLGSNITADGDCSHEIKRAT